MKIRSSLLFLATIVLLAQAQGATPYEICNAPLNISEADIQKADFDAYVDRLEAEQERACSQVEQAIDSYSRLSSQLLSPAIAEQRAAAERKVSTMRGQVSSLANEIIGTPAEISSSYADKFTSWRARADNFAKDSQTYQTALSNLKRQTEPLIESLRTLKTSGSLSPEMAREVDQTISESRKLSTPSSEVGNLVAELYGLLSVRRETFNRQVQVEINNYIAGTSRSLFSNLTTQRFILEADQLWGPTKVSYAVERLKLYGLYRTALNYLKTTEEMVLNAKKNVTPQSRPELIAQFDQSISRINLLKSQVQREIDNGGVARTKGIEKNLRSNISNICNVNDGDFPRTIKEIDRRIKNGEQLVELSKKNVSLGEIAQLNAEMVVQQLRLISEVCKARRPK